MRWIARYRNWLDRDRVGVHDPGREAVRSSPAMECRGCAAGSGRLRSAPSPANRQTRKRGAQSPVRFERGELTLLVSVIATGELVGPQLAPGDAAQSTALWQPSPYADPDRFAENRRSPPGMARWAPVFVAADRVFLAGHSVGGAIVPRRLRGVDLAHPCRRVLHHRRSISNLDFEVLRDALKAYCLAGTLQVVCASRRADWGGVRRPVRRPFDHRLGLFARGQQAAGG